MNIHCLDIFLKRFGTNVPEVFEILGLVLKARTKLRVVDKSMYNEHGVFISCAPPSWQWGTLNTFVCFCLTFPY